MKLHKDNYLYSPLIGNFASWFIAFTIMSFYVNGKTDNILIMPLGLLIGSIWTLWLHGYREAERIEIKKQKINHDKRFWQRSAVCLFIGQITHVLIDGFIPMAFIKGTAATIYLGTIVWLLFDSFLSIHRNLPWIYITSDPRGAKTDRFFEGKLYLWIISKVVLFFAGLALYIWILHLPLKH